MHVTAKVDYAIRALVEMAATDATIRAEDIARAQDLPIGFLRAILTDLRRAGLVSSHPGATGGFRLARSASDISLGDVFRTIEGPLAEVRGLRPDELDYRGHAGPLRDVWVAVRANLRSVLDRTTIADVASGRLPRHVSAIAARPGAWELVGRPPAR